MSSNNIVQLRTVKQVTQEGIYTLHGLARTKLIIVLSASTESIAKVAIQLT